MSNWLVKEEPEKFSFDDLAERGATPWTGVRNYEARNNIRDGMRENDRVLFYHSGKAREIVGVARVASDPYPDPAQYDPDSPYYDEKATEEEPRWFVVDVEAERALETPVSLDEVKEHPVLSGSVLANRARLSVQPVTDEEFAAVLELASEGGDGGRSSRRA